MTAENIYLIKDLSRSSGVSIYTIKFYLKLGIIKEVGRSPATNFRYFDNSTLDALKKIIGLRKDKISLAKIKTIIEE